jgi:hypothetical protein
MGVFPEELEKRGKATMRDKSCEPILREVEVTQEHGGASRRRPLREEQRRGGSGWDLSRFVRGKRWRNPWGWPLGQSPVDEGKSSGFAF